MYGATGQISSKAGTLNVSDRNLPDLVSRVGKVLRQALAECYTCRHRMIVSSEEMEVLKDERFKSLLTGEEYDGYDSITYKENEFVFSITLMPNDEEGFERVLSEAEKHDIANGHIPVEQ
jgi:hypothetical protein